jgi:HNH endonuclease
MRDVTTPEQARIRDHLVRECAQRPEHATAAILANFCCEYCKMDFLDPDQPDNHLHWIGWDHLIPRSKGGPDTVDNLACCCFICNRVKRAYDPRAAFTPTDYFAAIGSGHTPPSPSRERLVEVARNYIVKKKAEGDRTTSQLWREIVGRNKGS